MERQTTYRELNKGDRTIGGFTVLEIEEAGNGWVSIVFEHSEHGRSSVERYGEQLVLIDADGYCSVCDAPPGATQKGCPECEGIDICEMESRDQFDFERSHGWV